MVFMDIQNQYIYKKNHGKGDWKLFTTDKYNFKN